MAAGDVRCVHVKNPTADTISGAIAAGPSSIAWANMVSDGLSGVFIASVEGA